MTASKEIQYKLNSAGEFIINEYNSAKLFSSFFPGVAGKQGMPMWLFYVNRGQCVCSMGVQDKEHPIMEFLPANRAYQLASSQGFRTFIKPLDHESVKFYEPFQNHLTCKKSERSQRMIIKPHSLTLEEIDNTLGLKFTVDYFNVPQDNFSGLIRVLKIQNLNSGSFSLEGLDGLPLIIPYGIDNNGLKFMRRLVEAFVEVSNYDTGVPFFRGKVKPTDSPDVVRIKKGNFYVGFESLEEGSRQITPIVDPVKIFGSQSDYNYPERFLNEPVESIYQDQILENRLPCSMGYFKTSIPAGETYTYTSIIGHALSIDDLNDLIPKITRKSYIQSKSTQNKELIESLTQNNFISSSQPVLDQYTRQNFLDNTLRGGFPHTIDGKNSKFTLHLYSRKHGDLERDYNDYKLTPTYFSQGNGNYRDVNQNRRNDLLFNPDVKADNVIQFYNLIQLDGFNPLVIKETYFKVIDKNSLNGVLKEHLLLDDLEPIQNFLQSPFTPGKLFTFMRENNIDLPEDFENFVAEIINFCSKVHASGYGEGFWTDHWHYNLDLLENYLAVYPENLNKILFENKRFTFYDNPHRVQPRSEKYVLWDGNAMQLGSVIFDEEKEDLIAQRQIDKNLVHTDNGKGTVYSTSLINKFLSLIVNKMASLDPEGVGVEMESDKPNWYDALNGLPGQLGSSISETLEIRRHILFLLDSFKALNLNNYKWQLFSEMKDFMGTLISLLKSRLSEYDFWDKATTAKEFYRQQTRMGISGKEEDIQLEEIVEFLSLCLKKLDAGIAKAWDPEKNVISTYFINKVKEYEELTITGEDGTIIKKTNPRGLTCFKALKFEQRSLPLFLEGPVHYLRGYRDLVKARILAENIRSSGLYDTKLKMYKVNESLAAEPPEIGRARTFSPGWFENESIWLHMEYKYMLELLRSGLHDEFFKDFKQVFIPFTKPEVYGRSILENSSFICSSANPDPSIHGNGFVARLSGATAEFIHILFQMTIGSNPFTINEKGELELKFQPSLPGWLFTTEEKKSRLFIDGSWQEVMLPANTFSFMFLGSILVTYHNNKRADTFGADSVSPNSWIVTNINGESSEYTEEVLSGEIVEKIRAREIKSINIILK